MAVAAAVRWMPSTVRVSKSVHHASVTQINKTAGSEAAAVSGSRRCLVRGRPGRKRSSSGGQVALISNGGQTGQKDVWRVFSQFSIRWS